MTREKFKLDDREIIKIGWQDNEIGYQWVIVGENEVTKIDHKEQYCGEYSIHWLQVWKTNDIAVRFNAMNVDCVSYIDDYY